MTHHKLTRWTLRSRALTVALLVLWITGSGCSMFHASVTRRYQEAVARAPFDALIIPGYPSKQGDWNRPIQARVLWACHLHRTGVVRHLIFSGGAVRSPYVEAEIMAQYARALGVPAEFVHTETEALHTSENLFFSYRLAQQLGLESVAAGSDPVQTWGLRHFSRQFDLPIAMLPIDFVVLSRLPTDMPDIDPGPAYDPTFRPLRERFTRTEIRRNSGGARVRSLLVREAAPSPAGTAAADP